jgi:hypothetical protein
LVAKQILPIFVPAASKLFKFEAWVGRTLMAKLQLFLGDTALVNPFALVTTVFSA